MAEEESKDKMNISFLDSRIVKFIEGLDKSNHAKVSHCFDLLKEFGNRIGLPHSKKVTKDFYELRISGQVAVRLFYIFHGDEAVIIHGFIKKTQNMPQRELAIAVRKLKLLRRK